MHPTPLRPLFGLKPPPGDAPSFFTYDTIHEIPAAYRFSRMGGCSVICRASVVRIVFMALLATAIIAAVSGMGGDEDGGIDNFAYGCALAASVNGIAAFHYFIIWMVRMQNMGEGWTRWRARVGRVPATVDDEKGTLLAAPNGGTLAEERQHDAIVVFAQEMYIDGLRHSDWAITLVLMLLHLHTLAHGVSGVSGKDPPLFSREVAAGLQPVIISLGAVGRFFTNELRKDRHGWRPPPPVVAVAFACYVGAFVIFCLTTYNLLAQAGLPDDVPGGEPETARRRSDARAVWFVGLVQVGYPVVTAVQVTWLQVSDHGDAGNTYPALLSFFKDLGYGTLDVLTKGGLALYTASRVEL